MTLADRLVVLNHGVIQQEGSPLELYRRPANLFVAGFIVFPAMNFYEVTIEGGAARSTSGLPFPLVSDQLSMDGNKTGDRQSAR